MNRNDNECTDASVPPVGSGTPLPGPDDPRVIVALEEYAAALQAGRAPDRDAFQARHPEIAVALAECLDGLELMCGGAVGASSADGPAASSAGAGVEPGATMDDYRLLREIGRGGMGVVYEAEQVSLHRRVALKVLPYAAALDPKHLQRFKNEAQAAAQLHHNNIVPVYAVGCEGGVHYYAMQFIEGQSLAALIQQMRESPGSKVAEVGFAGPARTGALAVALASGHFAPARPDLLASGSPPSRPVLPETETAAPTAGRAPQGGLRGREYVRTVAHLGMQAAEALEHVHQLGVVHRDVKPANLLLDVRGNLWVTDFGLAHLQGHAGELTGPGDLIGTLRYMSPEQTGASRAPPDHYTDIYALGVTLYELLTLEPAFDGRDRREVLRQIAFEEPCPPRRRNPSIPTDLETVVLKAMAKSPAERYGTAQNLADDLRRYLEDRPVLAQRPTLRQWAAKWIKRHKGVAWMAFVLLAVVATGSTGSTGIIAWELHRADGERDRAVRAEGDANRNLAKALAAEREKTEELWQAKLAQAQAGRWSGRPGSIFSSLKALQEAAEITRALDRPPDDILTLRNEAIACMTLPDLRRIKDWDRFTMEGGSHDGHLLAAFFDAQSPRYATADGQGSITIHRMADDEVILRMNGPGAGVWSVGFSPDGRFLHAIYPPNVPSRGCRLWIWDLRTGENSFRLEPETSNANVVWSPDCRRFVVYGPAATVAIYDIGQRKEMARFSVGAAPQSDSAAVQEVAFHPNGKELAVLRGWAPSQGVTPVELRDCATGRLNGQFAFPVPIARLAWGGGGRILAGSIPDGTPIDESAVHLIYLRDAPAGPMHSVLKGYKNVVIDVAFNPAGDLLASTSWDGTIRLWNPWTGKELVQAQEGAWGQPLVFSPDGRFLSLTSSPWGWPPGRHWWEVHTDKALRRLHNSIKGEGFGAIEFSADGRILASEQTGGFRLWDLATFSPLAFLPAGNGPALFERTSSCLLTASRVGAFRWPFSLSQDEKGPVLRIGPPEKLDLTNGRASSSTQRILAAAHQGRALSPDGKWAAAGTARSNEGAKVWDAQSGQLVRRLPADTVGDFEGIHVCFSPDGKWLVTGSVKEYRTWEVGSWKPGVTVPRENGYLGGEMAFSPDAALLAVANSRWEVQLIEPATGRQVVTLPNPESRWVNCLAFSPDGSRLAVSTSPTGPGEEEAELRLFDLRVIRRQLAEMALDWDLPPYPAPSAWEGGSVLPLQVDLKLGELKAK